MGSTFVEPPFDLFHLESWIWVAARETGFTAYDYGFDGFACRRPWQRPADLLAVARLGAAADYGQRHAHLASEGIRLIHTPVEYERCSELPKWYPLIEDLTPRSVVFDHRPTAREVVAHFPWPVFMKGQRQTSRHQRSLSIIEGPEQFARATEIYDRDPILRWQRLACREFVPLRLVGEQSSMTMPRAFEFRTFWWHGQFVAGGAYWRDQHYTWSEQEKAAALAVGYEAARRVDVPFLVLDLAERRDDAQWIVIECNDGQDSGYATIAPAILWRRLLAVEEERRGV